MLISPRILLILGVVISGYTNAARILMVVPEEVKSHYSLGDNLLRRLALRDHEVTMISPLKPKKLVKNYRHIMLSGINEGMIKMMNDPTEKSVNFFLFQNLPVWKQILNVIDGATATVEIALTQPSFQTVLNDPNERFDLIVFLIFHIEALYGLAHKYDAPVVIIGSTISSVWTNHLVGNPAPSSYVPDFTVGYTGSMTLIERIHSTVHNFANELYRRYVYFPQLDATMHKFFPDAPPLLDIMYNRTAMVLLNSHPTITEIAPHVPAMVEVGGFHIEEPEPLPKELQEFMDDAPHGIILFSLGSNLQSSELSNSTRDHILTAFSRVKQKVIWKFEEENLPRKPDNVMIIKWAPQTDIMAHPNLKLFITHGGLLSVTEAVHYGIPIIGIPVFADQYMNIAITTQRGYGVRIYFDDLSEKTLFAAIQEVVTNIKYKKAIQVASQILRGQPVSPIDSAIFWVEHVIQHRGAKYLRSAALKLEWYQLYSVDIICIFLVILLCIYYITICTKSYFECCIQTHFRSKEKKQV